MPIEVLGLNGTPVAGDELMVVPSESRAREIAEFRQRRRRELQSAANKRTTLEQMMQNIKEGEAKDFPILIKGDVHGSVEALKTALVKLSEENTEVRVHVLDAAVGAITESDVTLANASKGMIVGFNVRANPQAREMAKRDGVEIRYYSIIYNVIDDVKQALSGMLAPELREKFLGNAAIQQVFNITRVGKVTASSAVARRFACCVTMLLFTKVRLRLSSASKTRSRKSATASNAAWLSKIMMTSKKAMSSNASRSRKSRGSYKELICAHNVN
jgi:translation initiation factor IF-2